MDRVNEEVFPPIFPPLGEHWVFLLFLLIYLWLCGGSSPPYVSPLGGKVRKGGNMAPGVPDRRMLAQGEASLSRVQHVLHLPGLVLTIMRNEQIIYSEE